MGAYENWAAARAVAEDRVTDAEGTVMSRVEYDAKLRVSRAKRLEAEGMALLAAGNADGIFLGVSPAVQEYLLAGQQAEADRLIAEATAAATTAGLGAEHLEELGAGALRVAVELDRIAVEAEAKAKLQAVEVLVEDVGAPA